MRKYELMVVVPVDFPHEDEKKVNDLIKKLLNGQPVEKVNATVWGKRSLAYEIKKQTEAVYLLTTFESTHVDSKKVEQQVKLEPLVLRYLLTRVEDNA